MNSVPPRQGDYLILIPMYNDWVALRALLRDLYRTAGVPEDGLRILIVDDGSPQAIPGDLADDLPQWASLDAIRVLRLRRNLGHQRAICIGLAYVHAHWPEHDVIVMDGDGEDRPSDIPRLIDARQGMGDNQVLFAERSQRSEGPIFRAGYWIYQCLFKVLTGHRIRMGNFSLIPSRLVGRLVAVSELWNHYVGAVIKARLPYAAVPTQRGNRYAGRSSMDLLSLVLHGLSSISVFAENVGVRALASTGVLLTLLLLTIMSVVAIRLGTDLAIPGWASYMVGLLLVMVLNVLLLITAFIIFILSNRNQTGFLPIRDFSYFILTVETLPPPST